MKKRLLILSFSMLTFLSYGQRSTYDTIRVDASFTVHVVFESKIVDYTLGSGELQGVDGTYTEVGITQAGDNKIKLAANVEHFETTNLFVETTSGYFNFILKYADFPVKQIFPVRDQDATLKKSELSSSTNTSGGSSSETAQVKDAEIKQGGPVGFYESIKRTPLKPSSIAKKLQGVQYYVSGIFTNGEWIGIKLVIENLEDLRYTLSYVNWTITEKKSIKSKKGSVEYNEPLHAVNEPLNVNKTLKRGEQGIFIFIFEKFTLSKSQELLIEIGEKDGSRTCDLKVNQNSIIKADYLSD